MKLVPHVGQVIRVTIEPKIDCWARRICPELVVLDGRHEVYRCFTDAIWEILRRYAPSLETFLDEAFADFSGTEHVYPDLKELGARIQGDHAVEDARVGRGVELQEQMAH